jgi:DNA modification methylase
MSKYAELRLRVAAYKRRHLQSQIICGDAIGVLKTLPTRSVQCVITSPPYFGLRDFGVQGQIGKEDTPKLYITRLVGVFREVWRVLKDDGTLWLNMGDTYASQGDINNGSHRGLAAFDGRNPNTCVRTNGTIPSVKRTLAGLKPKNLIGIPHYVGFCFTQ